MADLTKDKLIEIIQSWAERTDVVDKCRWEELPDAIWPEIERERTALVGIIKNERDRWSEVRQFAYNHNDGELGKALREASDHYAERSRRND